MGIRGVDDTEEKEMTRSIPGKTKTQLDADFKRLRKAVAKDLKILKKNPLVRKRK
jgi:hypothetical protein